MMEQQLKQIEQEAIEQIAACTNLKELNDIRVKFLGKKAPSRKC